MKIKIFVLLLCVQQFVFAQTEYFSILTAAPGKETYSTFGHTALRYRNDITGQDIVFNYGIFRFSENFIYTFTKGETYYELGIQSFNSFIRHNERENRPVIEQKLQLTQAQKNELLAYLDNNYKPENRTYLYNFLFDNCSTRPKNIIQTILHDSIIWNYNTAFTVPKHFWYSDSCAQLQTKFGELTWRDILQTYCGANSWLHFGISIALGAPCDYKINQNESMFLPDMFMFFASTAQIKTKTSTIDLVESTTIITNPKFSRNSYDFVKSPTALFLIIAILFIAVSFWEFKKNTQLYFLDSFVYVLTGILGILVWYLSFVSIHPVVFPNFNMLWAVPLHIFFAVGILIKPCRKYLLMYKHVITIITVIYIMSSPFNPQYIHPAFYAIFIIIISRDLKWLLQIVNDLKVLSKNR